MTQEIIDKIFESELGQQLIELWVTPDDRYFIRYMEANGHCVENGLNPKDITLWFPSN